MHKTNLSIIVTAAAMLSGCVSDEPVDIPKTVDTSNTSETIKVVTANELSQEATQKQPLEQEITIAVEQALSNNDYRLFHSQGRRMVVPGLEQVELSLLKSQCGIKPMANTGDVIKSKAHGLQRKALYIYTKEYNKAMYLACKNNIEK